MAMTGSLVAACHVLLAVLQAPPARGTLRLYAVGDINLGRHTARERLIAGDTLYSFRPLLDTLRGADITFGNLESPIAADTGQVDDSGAAFTAPPVAALALAQAGFDIVSTANNHAWDGGEATLQETMRQLTRAGVLFVGSGLGRDMAEQPVIVRRGNWRVAFFAITRAWNPAPYTFYRHAGANYVAWGDTGWIFPAIRGLKQTGRADLVVVSVHGGKEFVDAPPKYHQDLLYGLVDAGADLVLAHHPHALQPVVRYKGKPIVQSLGNSVFLQNDPWTRPPAILRVVVTPDKRMRRPAIPRVVVAERIDESGLQVTHIDDDGYLYFGGIGGWDSQVLVGQRVVIAGPKGPVPGVVGKQAIHLMKKEDMDKVSKITDLWIDVGAANRAEALERVRVGDPAVLDADVQELPNGRIVSRSIDNRIGAYVVAEVLRLLAKDRPKHAAVFAVATTREEIAWTGGGARTSAVGLDPQVALVVDVTHATDYPGAEKKRAGEHKLGGGPVLARGSSVSPVVFDLLVQCAEQEQIPYSVQAAPHDTSTDADAIYNALRGIPTGLVSVPNRYMHSPNEMVAVEDLERVARLLAAFARRLDPKVSFIPT